MSRSKKGSKGVGYDYWSKRASATGVTTPGKGAKQETHSKERAQARQSLLKEPREPEYDEREHVPSEDE